MCQQNNPNQIYIILPAVQFFYIKVHYIDLLKQFSVNMSLISYKEKNYYNVNLGYNYSTNISDLLILTNIQWYSHPGPEVDASMKDTSPRPRVFLGQT